MSLRRIVHPRVVLFATLALSLLALVAQGPAPRAPMTREAAALLADGASWADSLVASTRPVATAGAVAAPSAIALGYLERHRLGLGSPFRLIELALSDPRLGAPTQRRLAWALLERARRGEGAMVDAAALRLPSMSDSSLSGEQAHLAVIERAVGGAADPRAGELAVRLAYSLAGTEGTVLPLMLTRVMRAAALARDRETASADVRRLLRSAHASRVDPLALVSVWRRERWFAVERPPAADGLGPDRDEIERGAIAMAPEVLAGIRAAARTDAPVGPPPPASTPLLGAGAAAKLAQLAERWAPPATPIVVAMRTERRVLAEEGAPAALVHRARNEETLAAVNALLAVRGDATPSVARVVLDAALGMRAFAQEPAWHPGGATLDADETASRLGILAVDFDREVPRAWRSYYLSMLSVAVGDLQRVLPDLTLDGLRVRFAAESPGGDALAIHDPRTRTVVFPVATAAGTIAHELAHDLDWQAARTLYRRRGTYSTDVAIVRSDRRLAESLRGMTAARLIPPSEANGFRPPHQQRPAEVFARNVDWFVAVSLAREGRSDGYLSAVQDEALTGYASVLPREVGGRGSAALLDALQEMAFVSDDTREWFLSQWGATRALRPAGVVREVIALSSRRGEGEPAPSIRLPSAGWSSLSIEGAVHEAAATCDVQPASPSEGAAGLAWLALESRARGIVHARARWFRDATRPPWARAVLGMVPFDPTLAERVQRREESRLLSQLRRVGALSAPFEVGEVPVVEECR